MPATMILTSKLISSIALISLIFTSKFDESTEENSDGFFTTDLIHRDSPQSPSYDPSLSPSQRIANALKRSFHRARRFKERRSNSGHAPPQSDLIYSTGAYLMKFSVGTPPLPAVAIADTGSDIIWTQCHPCLQCIHQSLPIFRPKNSSTYRKIDCGAPRCNSLPETYCSRNGRRCLYSESYQDSSFTDGELATDTFTLESSRGKSGVLSIPKITFGCGFKNSGVFSGSESGIVGLGGGKASLVRQLGRLAKGRFSYCLVSVLDESNSSKLHFGKANSGSKRAVTTPLVEREPETFYYLTIDGISVGNRRLGFTSSESDSDLEGNVIIDSGTTFTLLPEDFYEEVENAIDSSIDLDRIEDPANELRLCYLSRREIEIPEITVHFRGGDVKWKHENIFVRTSDETVCLAAQPSQDIAIYGNLAQVNFLVGYDLVKRTVSFEPTDCGRS